jgi:hemoglobin
MIPPRFDITEDQIARVVATFYSCIRAHPGLGPVFAAHVQDWPAHEAKITRFWKNAILHQRGYDGNPLAVHRAAGNVRLGMFNVWLGLFDSVLKRELPPETAMQWSALAHRIARGLTFGMQGEPGAPPSLR